MKMIEVYVDDLDLNALNVICSYIVQGHEEKTIKNYCEDWSLAGPLIEKYKVSLTSIKEKNESEKLESRKEVERLLKEMNLNQEKNYGQEPSAYTWHADITIGEKYTLQTGPTALIALAKAIVAAHDGEKVSVPDTVAASLGYDID